MARDHVVHPHCNAAAVKVQILQLVLLRIHEFGHSSHNVKTAILGHNVYECKMRPIGQ